MSLSLNGEQGQRGMMGMVKEGTRMHQGVEEAVNRNIAACRQLADIVRSSFGPSGLSKIVVNHLDQVFVTNDAGVIVREMEIEHPAARLLLLASQQQKAEFGDASNTVLLLSGEFLTGAEELLRLGLKPSQIAEGYEKCQQLLLDSMNDRSDLVLNSSSIRPLIRNVIASQHLGYEDLLSNLVIDALRLVHPSSLANIDSSVCVDSQDKEFPTLTQQEMSQHVLNTENVRIVKILGGSIAQSTTFSGLLIEREPFGRVRAISSNAKVAVFSCPLSASRTETKGTVLFKDAQQMSAFSKGEEEILQNQIASIAASGANVVVSADSISELALHFLERAGIMALKMPSKFDIRRLCRAVGATPLARLGAPTAEEMGHCMAVETVEVGGTCCTLFRQASGGIVDSSSAKLATILLRSNTQSQLDDMERTLQTALSVVRNRDKDARVVFGAGAAEMSISLMLMSEAERTPGIAQYAMRRFAAAFEAIPRQLATNAGQDASETMAKLEWAHSQHREKNSSNSCSVCIDIDSTLPELLVDSPTPIVDHWSSKRNAILLATEAALTVLRVDLIVRAKQAQGPKARPAGPQDPDDDGMA